MSYNSKNIKSVTEIFSVQVVDLTFLKMRANKLMKVARIEEVISRKIPLSSRQQGPPLK